MRRWRWRRRSALLAAVVALAVGAAAVWLALLSSNGGRHQGTGLGTALLTPGSSVEPSATGSPSPSAAGSPSPSATSPGRTGSGSGGGGGTTHGSVPPGYRNPLLWPFASTSIWNVPIGRAAVYVPAGIAPATQRTVGSDQDIIVMSPSSPSTRFGYDGAGWSGASRCPVGTTLATAPLPLGFVVPSSTDNNGFAVLMSDGHTVLQGQPMARCAPGGPATTMHLSPPANLFTDGTLGAHGGSGLSSLGGTIRLGELVPGAPPIRHALKIDLDGAADYWPVGFSWPAIREDAYGPQRYGGHNPALKMGALLALPASLNLASLNLTTGPGRMIAWTLQNYGAYCVDDAARSSYVFATEAGPSGTVESQFQSAWGYPFVSGVQNTPWARDIATIFAHLSVVANNSPQSVGGGGPRLQPLAPALATIVSWQPSGSAPMLTAARVAPIVPISPALPVLVAAAVAGVAGRRRRRQAPRPPG